MFRIVPESWLVRYRPSRVISSALDTAEGHMRHPAEWPAIPQSAGDASWPGFGGTDAALRPRSVNLATHQLRVLTQYG
jgi:hypothetical protein